MTDQLSARRFVQADPGEIFALLRDPQGHVDIDASGMLQSAEGEPVSAVGDRFVVHMDRESLGDIPQMGRYDVEVIIERFVPDRELVWSISGTIQPPMGHTYGYRLRADEVEGLTGTWVTSVYDWSKISDQWRESGIFPVITERHLRASLGILDRVVRRRAGR